MTQYLKAAVACFGLATPLLPRAISAAQQKNATNPAPVPAQILAAKKVFIANGGGDEACYGDEALYSGGPDRTYNEFYAAMKNWIRYELAIAPADADLVFRDTANRGSTAA
jgi:hypothetical protein